MSTRNQSHAGTYRINLKLDPRDDADIITWLDGYPNGQRSTAVREAIRRGLGIAASVEPALDLEAIRQMIADELSRSLAGVRFQKHSGQKGASTDDAESRYGAKLDQMLGGISRGTTENLEDS
jgi:hypothetical protein